MVQSVIFCIFILSALEVSANNTTNLCNSFSTCGECIRSPYCAWCSEEGADNAPRCFKPNLHLPYIAELCSEDQVYFPAGTISWDDSSTGQLSPQIINLQLRVNEPLYFVIHFDKAANDTDISIVLNDNSSPYLSVEYISKCLGSYVETNVYCTNSIVLEASRHLHFNVKVELTKCPNGYKERYQKFQIFSENSTKSVDVNVETFCTCPCENPGFLVTVVNKGRHSSQMVYASL
uniref:Integrin beta N-terminal domain-containing protein n=1 Tax=Photinus pyralis TaxID=7054 RepID=A0A1Y1LG49_PHOPY